MGWLIGLSESSGVSGVSGGAVRSGVGPLGWVGVTCDLLTFVGCVTILVMLVYFVRRHRGVPFPRVFWTFCVLVFGWGMLHLAEAVLFWVPIYEISAAFKMVTTIALWGTVVGLVPLMTRAISLSEMKERNEQLREDVERQRADQKRLTDVNERLENTNRDLTRFAASISHDLLEPLRTIHGYASLLATERQAGVDDDTDYAIARIDACAQRLEDMIHGFLRVNKLGVDAGPRESVDVEMLVDATVRDLRQLLDSHDGGVAYGSLHKVDANPVLLRQIFQNLIVNAIKYRSSAPPRVEITCERTANAWRFAVKDNGMGIPEKAYKRIFEAFQRLRHRSDSNNLGLGLSIVQTAVQWHGGEVWVESVEGVGSTFYFTLPLVLPDHSGARGEGMADAYEDRSVG